jgi:hypothetical protein
MEDFSPLIAMKASKALDNNQNAKGIGRDLRPIPPKKYDHDACFGSPDQ